MNKAKEREIQRCIIEWLSYRKVFFLRINTGAIKRDNRFFRFGLPGVSDIMAIVPQFSWFAPVWIEVKTEKGRQSPLQVEFEKRVSGLGHIYILARKLEDVSEHSIFKGITL